MITPSGKLAHAACGCKGEAAEDGALVIDAALSPISHGQNQLTSDMPVLTAAVGSGSIGERVLVIDDDSQPPVVDEAHEPFEVLASRPGDDGDGAASRPRDGPGGMTKDPERVHGH